MSKNGSHELSNLVTVCADCHNAIHGNSMAPMEEPTGGESSFFSWAEHHIPPQFGTCPNCGSLNLTEASIKVRSSDNIAGISEKGYKATCSSCHMELHATSPSRWKLISGRKDLEGVTLNRDQWDRIGSALRDEGNVKKVIQRVKEEDRQRLQKHYISGTVAVLIGIVLFLFANSTLLGIFGLLLILGGSVFGLSAQD